MWACILKPGLWKESVITATTTASAHRRCAQCPTTRVCVLARAGRHGRGRRCGREGVHQKSARGAWRRARSDAARAPSATRLARVGARYRTMSTTATTTTTVKGRQGGDGRPAAARRVRQVDHAPPLRRPEARAHTYLVATTVTMHACRAHLWRWASARQGREQQTPPEKAQAHAPGGAPDTGESCCHIAKAIRHAYSESQGEQRRV
jgi:hypothetical protein